MIETAWEMFRRLYKKYDCRFLNILNDKCHFHCSYYAMILLKLIDYSEKKAIKIMRQIEKQLEEQK